ncbi:hypothetical protein [Azospirillum sp. A29]|uniref:hypothetical protein n=1 Tax=unclassified Azospirillum TaxID=2630922 RepID=UPI00366CA20E
MMTSSKWAADPISLFDTRGVDLYPFALHGLADTLAHTVTVGPIVAGMTLAPLQAPDDADRDQSR